MADFVRRLVSGRKARFKDGELDVELDLAYITDRVIVMGYPAIGFEGMYRNRREDAKKFLQHHHGNNYWVFNFCPTKENSYPANVFDGRVSRYPFPDHHAPPLAILPLIAREMRVWLDASPENVAVLHCKAGKGRSGTMACSYLLSLEDAPSPPTLIRSKTKKEQATARAEELMNTMPSDNNIEDGLRAERIDETAADPIKEELKALPNDSTSPPSDSSEKGVNIPADGNSTKNSLAHVLDLHTQGRMRRPSSPGKKVKQGVSIPSQRRWLYYWSLLLAHQGPPGFWSLNPENRQKPSPKVRLTSIAVRMQELSNVKTGIVRVANAVIDRTSFAKATHLRAATTKNTESHLWVSLARYDDDLVEELEKWEKQTRSEDGDLGRRKFESEHMDGNALSDLFADDKWDRGKMVRSFARLGTHGEGSVTQQTTNDEKAVTHMLRQLTGDNWELLRNDIETNTGKTPVKDGLASEEASLYDATTKLQGDSGVVLDAHRELRAKLYMGQVFMGWFWLIPTFHMPHPRQEGPQTATIKLTRRELDFALGVGSHIVDVEVNLEWCSETADVISPPERQTSVDSREGKGEPAGIAATIEAVAGGKVSEIVEAKQAAED
ncbi:phosphatases II [Cristinia sonorae]|uniref:phosphatidylinositol-3,4,5-trisphosphate 3-phosphatase n=1 Tax=Cristinia sonorae TaxID=1940300 RepID=A0A8K0XL63_9AGAR|nr:phosphatases II [Cristinia sonorae]